MNRSRIVGLAAVIILAVALLASTALAGAKAPEKKWEWGTQGSADPAQVEP
jgi:hypothetical protein